MSEQPTSQPPRDDIITPHLELEQQYLREQMPRYLEAYARFLGEPVDWLKISNMRLYTQLMGRRFETIDSLLAVLEQRVEKSSKEIPPFQWQELDQE